AIEMMRRMPELPMICDPSHISGNRDYLLEIAQKGADLNYNGMIIESHVCPLEAWSDASQQVTPDDLLKLVNSIQWREKDNDKEEYINALEGLRSQIDNLDSEIFSIFAKRMGVAEKIGEIKKANNVAILQTGRWSDIIEKASQQSKKLGLSEDFMMKILDAIHVESISRQNEVMNKRK
ncbi:MAG: chorismate mutase, partial [Rikenellaceae bacterium]